MPGPDDRNSPAVRLAAALARRFGDAPAGGSPAHGAEMLAALAEHRSHRAFKPAPVDPGLIRLLCATALSAPSKSDLQQRDIVIVEDKETRARLNGLMSGMDWLPAAPALLVVCGNNRRQRQLHAWRGRPFANDHLDAFFNAATDAAIVLGWLVAAAEAVGLGCCPLSVVRNEAGAASALLALPDHVFPYAGLALGWPAATGEIAPRLPLAATVHVDRFNDARVREQVEAYDRRREGLSPYKAQRSAGEYGTASPYGWSEDKARQYAKPERSNFGAFIRQIGFDLR